MYNVRVYHYVSGRQVRVYSSPVQTGYSRASPKDDQQEDDVEGFPARGRPTYYWQSDYLDGWEHYEPDPEERRKRSLASSLNRTKQAIFGVARANVWDYFLTLTFDRALTDSASYDLVMRRAQKWLNNIRYRYCPDLQYLIVPELHADGVHWHLHGLLSRCDELTLIDSGHKDDSGRPIYNLQNWKYGFSTVTKIDDMAKVSSYITKYITKNLCEVTQNKHRYLVSRNCLKASDVCEELLISGEENWGIFFEDMSEKLTYSKSHAVVPAHRVVNYFELKN